MVHSQEEEEGGEVGPLQVNREGEGEAVVVGAVDHSLGAEAVVARLCCPIEGGEEVVVVVVEEVLRDLGEEVEGVAVKVEVEVPQLSDSVQWHPG